ncbi:hypothetical protein AB0C29_26155 [Actinoplanes sp. NPDC048791]|uniref:hypothetical protein n=1 Tax=Actinoplanes sp. NPDC048791 TaxID=3154623 RepID=UPI0033F6F20E
MGAMRRAPVVAVVGAIAVSLAGAVPAEAAATWRIAAEPPLKPASRLVDVSATGPADAWAVGYQDNAYGRIPVEPAALVRWNGRTWSESLLPAPFDSPEAVSAVDPSNVWAVGQDDRQLPYAARWDGTAWQGMSVADQGRFSDVAARNGRPLIVGARRAGGALVMEWDGQGLREVVVPGSDRWSGGLQTVATAPGGAAFAVGSWHVDDAGYPEPLIVQRTGGTWRVAALPKVPGARLTGVHARSATDAWAVGTIEYDSSRPKPLIMHWDGVSWQRVAAPTESADLWAVGGDAAGNLWVTGSNPSEPYGVSYPGSLFLRYQGGKWSVVYGPKVRADNPFWAADPFLSAVENIPGTSALWGVGTVSDPARDHVALVERIG